MRFRSLTAFLLLGVSACTVGPDFTPPKADVPAAWSSTSPKTGQPVSAVTTAASASGMWWTAFNDPELNSLIDRAKDTNFDLRQSVLRIEEARAQMRLAGAKDLPQLSLDNSYTRSLISPNGALGLFGGGGGGFGGTGGGGAGSGAANGGAIPSGGLVVPPFNIYQTGFDASWELDLFGRVRRSIEAAGAQTEAALEDRNDVLLSVYAEVARNYVQLRGVQRLVAITKDNLDAQQQAYNLTKAQAAGGETSNLDVESAAAVVATTAAQLPTLEDQQNRLVNALSRLLGREPGALLQELEATKAIPPVPPSVPIGLPSELARRRPDIRRAEAQLHVATAQIGVAVADLYPRLSLAGSFGMQALHFDQLGDWASRFYNIGPSLSIPIFNGTTYANISLQEFRQQEAALTYENTVLGALHEVENAVSSYGTEQVRLRSLQQADTANRNSLSLAQQRYKAGLSSFLEVLDAERRMFETDTAVVNSTMSISTNLIAVYKALGGDWETGAETSSTASAPAAQTVAAH